MPFPAPHRQPRRVYRVELPEMDYEILVRLSQRTKTPVARLIRRIVADYLALYLNGKVDIFPPDDMFTGEEGETGDE